MTTKREATTALLNLSTRLTRLQVEELQKLPEPLSLRQYRILRRVDGGVRSITVLAKMAERSLPTISRSVESLIQRGLLTRTLSTVDARTHIISLSRNGKAALSAAEQVQDDLARWLEAALADGDADWLERLSQDLFNHAGSRLGADGPLGGDEHEAIEQMTTSRAKTKNGRATPRKRTPRQLGSGA